MPWAGLAGNPTTDTSPYATAKATDDGIGVRVGEREWLLANEPGTRPVPPDFLPDPTAGS